MMLEINQRLEDDFKAIQIVADKLKIEKATLQQRIKIMEHDIKRAQKDEGHTTNLNNVNLQKEIEELKVTNLVYLEKINELVDQLNKMDEQNYLESVERNRQMALLQKQNEQLLAKIPENDKVEFVKNTIKVDVESVARHKVANPVSFGKLTADNDDDLRQENEGLKIQMLHLKNKNMDLLNQLSDYKMRHRSRSDNRKH
jgi:hypothetical protein